MPSHGPLVSVIIAAYNRETLIRQSVESVLAQTYPHFELIVVDDCSTDATASVVREYAERDRRVRYVKTDRNGGPSYARNIALREAQGTYVAVVDSDDVCCPERLAKQVAYLEEHPEIGVLGTGSYSFSDDPAVCTEGEAYFEPISEARCPIAHPTAMLRRDLFERYGYYNPRYRVAEDHDIFYRFAAHGVQIASLPEKLYKHRLHQGNISSTRLRSLLWTGLKINLRGLFRYHFRYSRRGYRRIGEQAGYLLYLSLGLDRAYKRSVRQPKERPGGEKRV